MEAWQTLSDLNISLRSDVVVAVIDDEYERINELTEGVTEGTLTAHKIKELTFDMPKPVIDQDKCIGCGSCELVCPVVFKLNEEGKAQVKSVDFKVNKHDIDQAIDLCPTEAISWGE